MKSRLQFGIHLLNYLDHEARQMKNAIIIPNSRFTTYYTEIICYLTLVLIQEFYPPRAHTITTISQPFFHFTILIHCMCVLPLSYNALFTLQFSSATHTHYH
jgi:hypothetical protein